MTLTSRKHFPVEHHQSGSRLQRVPHSLAVGLGVFTLLGTRAMTGEELGKELELHPRGIWDFLDALVALGFLDREGNGSDGRYSNTPSSAQFLDKNSPAYIGGILEMWEDRSYQFWGDFDKNTEGKLAMLASSIPTGR